ncbi:MAG TPA: pilus assembly protein TadG-related protein [Propylenella sp.]|nr:pilus assembly protein TadG-related protein [Propylenella sp.]
MIVAVAFPVLIGGMGLGAEVGYWYLTERRLQHAADLAAFAAAVRLAKRDDDATLDAVALHVARESGFTEAYGSIEVHHPPIAGPNAGNDEMVEVKLTRNLNRAFSQFFHSGPVGVQGRAVALAVPGAPVCALALSPSASNALYAKGSASASFENCVIASNSESASSFHMQGATVAADCVYAAGGYQSTGGSNSLNLAECEEVEEDHDPIADPYADIDVPTAATPCLPVGTIQNTTVTPLIPHSSGMNYVRYCSLTVKGNVTFQPGLYIIDGDFTNTGNTTLSGTGVTFVIRGNVTLNGNLTMSLSAPTSGPYSGILFFGDDDATLEAVKINGNASSVLQGAIYFQTGDLLFTGSSAASDGCTQIIANTIEFSGNSGIRSSCDNAGVREISGDGRTARLSE